MLGGRGGGPIVPQLVRASSSGSGGGGGGSAMTNRAAAAVPGAMLGLPGAMTGAMAGAGGDYLEVRKPYLAFRLGHTNGLSEFQRQWTQRGVGGGMPDGRGGIGMLGGDQRRRLRGLRGQMVGPLPRLPTMPRFWSRRAEL